MNKCFLVITLLLSGINYINTHDLDLDAISKIKEFKMLYKKHRNEMTDLQRELDEEKSLNEQEAFNQILNMNLGQLADIEKGIDWDPRAHLDRVLNYYEKLRDAKIARTRDRIEKLKALAQKQNKEYEQWKKTIKQ